LEATHWPAQYFQYITPFQTIQAKAMHNSMAHCHHLVYITLKETSEITMLTTKLGLQGILHYLQGAGPGTLSALYPALIQL
jgi:hypothetical protein